MTDTPEDRETARIEAAAKAFFFENLHADDEETFGVGKTSDWCREVARTILTAADAVDDRIAAAERRGADWMTPAEYLSTYGLGCHRVLVKDDRLFDADFNGEAIAEAVLQCATAHDDDRPMAIYAKWIDYQDCFGTGEIIAPALVRAIQLPEEPRK
ncbi:hypothetical protein [Ahrensia sp. R2A130]|uniref:hypothetical protein n=1 Tax=Ahrensia sp. R2A130 TaxID=744979 RepID=UPI0001E0BCCF|nr:hypothetical protein [Ahrensia sp. R2A130]EFL88343.1 putative membrane primary amine oxidase [Ahrensia sp. R2A130]